MALLAASQREITNIWRVIYFIMIHSAAEWLYHSQELSQSKDIPRIPLMPRFVTVDIFHVMPHWMDIWRDVIKRRHLRGSCTVCPQILHRRKAESDLRGCVLCCRENQGTRKNCQVTPKWEAGPKYNESCRALHQTHQQLMHSGVE